MPSLRPPVPLAHNPFLPQGAIPAPDSFLGLPLVQSIRVDPAWAGNVPDETVSLADSRDMPMDTVLGLVSSVAVATIAHSP